MKFKVTILLLLLLPIFLFGETISYSVPKPEIIEGKFENELPKILEAGNPQLPYIPLKILLPMGHKIRELELSFGKELQKEEVNIKPAAQMQPISKPNLIAEPQTNVYQKNEDFPKKDYDFLGTQSYRGYNIALVNVYPYKYNPQQQKLKYLEEFVLTWTSSYEEDLAAEQLRKVDMNRGKLRRLDLENISAAASYKSKPVRSRNLPIPEDPYTMIIITNQESEPYFEDFINWKEDNGVHTGIFVTENIYASYSGVDNQEKIRNFIIDAYETYNSTSYPLEYVILGGDDEIIPIRGCYGQVGGTVDYNIPTDMYYGSLDGSWDADGDGIYGEQNDNVDLFPEVAVGRISAETEHEFDNFFNKNYSYVDEPVVSNDISLMIGENLDDNPTWGGDYKDQVLADCSLQQDGFHVNKLYERDGTFSANAVKHAINNGVSIINHMGHSNETIVFGQNSGNAQQYYNNEYGFAYSQGCYPAAFDTATSGDGECVAENMIIASGGLFAFIGNTRYGWYSPGNVWGASEYFDIEFFKAIFDYDIRNLGDANDYSKMELVNMIQTSSVMRWVAYELVVLGDPSLQVKEYNGNFPFLQPASVVYNDVEGDGDGTVNPGETINVEIELENLPNWASANNVYAKIEFANQAVEVIEDSVYYGNINSGSLVESEPFVVGVPQDCNYDSYEYYLRIIAPVGEGNFDRSYTMSFEISLYQENWPVTLSANINSNPIVTDFNADGQLNIVAVDKMGSVSIFDASAQLQSGFPWEYEYNIWKSTAYGDLNNNGQKELVYSSRNNEIVALKPDGDYQFEYFADSGQLFTPVLADINGDGNLEIISSGIDNNLITLNSNGEIVENFPVQLPAMVSNEIAAADLNNDSAYEIILTTLDGNVNAITANGENLDGFPVELGAVAITDPIILPNKKIVVANANNQLMLISAAGNIEMQLSLASRVQKSPIAADFDGDGELEIAFSTQNKEIAIITQNGEYMEGWPITISSLPYNPPLAADIDNDSQIELLQFTILNNLYIFKPDGEQMDFTPVEINLSGNLPATIADIDEDGDPEVVSGISNGVYAIDIKTTYGSQHPWITYRGNYHRTGYFEDNDLVANEPQGLPEFKQKLFAAYPNPFNPSTNISFALSQPAHVNIIIYNIKGQKIRTLTSNEYEKGKYILNWNGEDNNLQSVSSGIYFYKMEVNGKTTEVRKCMLLK